MRKKGAIFTADFLMAMMIFTIIIISYLWIYEKVRTDVTDYSIRTGRREKALRLSDTLVSDRGKPAYWHLINMTSRDVHVIGLAGQDHVLMREKIQRLENSNYSVLKEVMGIGRGDFNLSIISNYTLNPTVEYSIGYNNDNASDQMVIRRLAIMDRRPVEVLLRISYDIH